MRTPHYWKFTLLFWLAAGLLLFVNALGIGHWPQVVMRFMYFPILGLALTAVLTLVFQSEAFRSWRWPAAWVIGFSILSGLVTAMILNPITYLILGLDLRDDHLQKMTTGLYGFTATYLFWCVLYFELDGRPLLGVASGNRRSYLAQIAVDDRGGARSIPVEEIECLAASGDYVDIHAGDRSYLKKATISSLLAALDPAQFRRVHRSTVVNTEQVAGIRPRGNGTFDITLRSGRVVTSSRSYRSVVDEMAAN